MNVDAAPVHNSGDPDIADGEGFTVTVSGAEDVHPLEAVAEIVYVTVELNGPATVVVKLVELNDVDGDHVYKAVGIVNLHASGLLELTL